MTRSQQRLRDSVRKYSVTAKIKAVQKDIGDHRLDPGLGWASYQERNPRLAAAFATHDIEDLQCLAGLSCNQKESDENLKKNLAFEVSLNPSFSNKFKSFLFPKLVNVYRYFSK